MKTVRSIFISIAFIVAMTGCVDQNYIGDPTSFKLAFIGDEVTSSMYGKIHDAFIWQTAVAGIDGENFEGIYPVAEQFAATSPDMVVVFAGHHDALQNNGNATDDFQHILDVFSDVPCLVVVSINSHNDNPAYSNAVAAVTKGGSYNGYPVDFDQNVIDFGPPDVYQPDGYNLTEAGQDFWISRVRNTLNYCSSMIGH